MNKKGSIIAESAVVFPVVILTVAALIYMMIYFYGQLSDRVDMHILLRSESGKICENMVYGTVANDDFTVYKNAQQIYSSSTAEHESKGILTEHAKEFSARKYLIDETEFVRMAGLMKDEIPQNEQ